MKKVIDVVQTQVSSSKGIEHINSNSNQEKIKINKVELNRQLNEAKEFVENEFLETVDNWYYDTHKFVDIFRYINEEAEFFEVPVNTNGDLVVFMSICCDQWKYDANIENLIVQCSFQVGNTHDNKMLKKIIKSLDKLVGDFEIAIPVPNEVSKRLLKKHKEIKQKEETEVRTFINSSEIITAPKTNEQFYIHQSDSEANLYSLKIESAENLDAINSELVGYIVFNTSSGEIMSLEVSRQFQGKGLGDVLFKAAIDKGCYWLYANGKRAYNMYQKYGFVAIGSIDSSQYRPIKNEDDFEEFKKKYRGTTAMMCLKNKLNEFGLEWNELQKEIDKFITSEYHGAMDSLQVGDTTPLGIVEDYDDDYYYLRDFNANSVKISRKTGK